MADEKIVKQKLRTLLKEVDFETATQRSITQKLEQELEVNLFQHKPMIKVRCRRRCRCTVLPARTPACAVLLCSHRAALQLNPSLQEEIDLFLAEQQDAADDEDDDFEAEAEAQPRAAKRQRAEGGGAVPTPPPGDCVVPLSAKRFASVQKYGGRVMADVREWYEKDGTLQVGSWLVD
jgi:hypothetical protein